MDMEGIYNIVKMNKTWINPILTYIQNSNLLRDRLEARKLQGIDSKYTVTNG